MGKQAPLKRIAYEVVFSTIISVNKHVSPRISRTPFPPPTLFTQSKAIKEKKKQEDVSSILFYE